MNMIMHRLVATAICILCLSHLRYAEGGKVLVMAMQFGSHLNEFAAVSEALIKIGHQVHVIMDENLKNPTQFKGIDVTFQYYKSPVKAMVDSEAMNAKLTEAHLVKRLSLLEIRNTVTAPRFTYDCKMALYDVDFVRRLADERYDIALADLAIPCYHLLAHKLGLPTVGLSSMQFTNHLRTSPLVNFVTPCDVTGPYNTFANRLKSFFKTIAFEKLLIPNLFVDSSEFAGYAPERPWNSMQDLIHNSTLFIQNKNGVIDCPTPSMQNLILVGGLTTKPPKALPQEYQSFLDDAKDGAIIVSFGSAIAALPEVIFIKLLVAFRDIKEKVVWRSTTTYGETIPGNVKIVRWMPQNDLLAHSNVKLFITHGGNNGQSEALSNAVPMLCLPVFGDQLYNGERLVHKGYGLTLDMHTFTTKQVSDAIREIINNPKYAETITKASAIHRALPDPRSTSAFWIDHVMKHGGAHLRTVLSDMTMVQYYMLDIFCFIALILGTVLFLMKIMIQKVLGMFRRREKDTKKKDN